MWQVLQITDAIDREFCSALSGIVPITGWSPRLSWTGAFQNRIETERIANPPLTFSRFPLQRGYYRFPISWLSGSSRRQLSRLLAASPDPHRTPLVCTTPYWAAVAKRWPGPVVYYLTDLMAAYAGANGKQVRELDQRMCRAATLVCPNSKRLGRYLVNETGCDPRKIEVIPNATRASNILAQPPAEPFPLPRDAADLRRPVAGVIGNLAGNMDWFFLRDLVAATPEFSWLFVGPTDMQIEDAAQRKARAQVMSLGGRVRFTGYKPYGELASYARSFDVAILPYFRREPTLSGSSTRFYEHLAACRPMLATPCFEELLEKQPYLKLVETADDAKTWLQDLKARSFDDGFAEKRWLASHDGTWDQRARKVVEALDRRVPGLSAGSLRAPVETATAEQELELRR